MRTSTRVRPMSYSSRIWLTLVDVKIQDSEPPTVEVIEAFKAVETAKQRAETVVNDAMAYQNAQLPQAQAALRGLGAALVLLFKGSFGPNSGLISKP